MGRLAWALAAVMAICPFASMADTGRVSDRQCFSDWCSCIFHINSQDLARIYAESALNKQTGLAVEYLRDEARMLVIIPKNGSDLGNVYLPGRQAKAGCSLFVDSHSSPGFSTTCDVMDDNANFYVMTGLVFSIPMYLGQGSRVRLQIGDGSGAFSDTFSLKGFSRAYKRTEQLRNERGLCPYCP